MFEKIEQTNSQVRSKIGAFLEKFGKLGLSSQCHLIRTDLMMFITNKDILSKQLTSQLMPSATGPPYHLHPGDAEQIHILKKISNILYNVEIILSSLEKIELTDEMYTLELAKHAPNVFKNCLKAMEQLNEAMELVNNSSASIQAIMGPQIQSLEPAYSYLMGQLNQFTPSGALEGVEKRLENVIERTVNAFPTRRKTAGSATFMDISSAISSIPNYFKQIQAVIESESLFPAKKSSPNDEDFQNRLSLRAGSISQALEKATNDANISQYLQHLKILKQLGSHASDLINTAAPATKEAYIKSVEKLNELKHDLLPKMISELESLEESLGLKSGVLTEPALDAANAYYTKLTDMVNKISEAADVFDKIEEKGSKWFIVGAKSLLLGDKQSLDTGDVLEKDPDLATLFDSTFIKSREQNQTKRLDEAKIRQHEAEGSKKAAEAFYKKVESINTFYNNGQFSNVSPQDKQELAFLYKQFQPYMAASNPELDTQIVNNLKLTTVQVAQLDKGIPEPTFIFSVLRGLGTAATYTFLAAQKMAEGSSQTLTTQENPFNTILDTKNKVIGSISRTISTQDLRIALINDARMHAEQSMYHRLGRQTLLEATVPQPILAEEKYDKTLSVKELYQQRLVFENQYSDITRAETSFNNFIKKLEGLSQPNDPLRTLNEVDKELLRAEYKKFQPFICHLAEKNTAIKELNIQIVNSLMNPSETSKEPLTPSQIVGLKSTIGRHFETLKQHSATMIDMYSASEAKASANSGTLIPLEPIGITSKNTLAAQLKESNLSTKIDNFLQRMLIPALKKNLDEELVKQLELNGDISKLKPYRDNNEDISHVKLYKNLINSILLLKQALKAYEDIDKGFGSIAAISLGQFIYTIGTAAAQAEDALKSIQNNPILADLAKQGMDTISQLKQHPQVAPNFEAKLQGTELNISDEQTNIVEIAVHDLQLSLLNLVTNTNPFELEEQYSNLKNNFMHSHQKQFSDMEVFFGLPQGNLSSEFNTVFTNFELNLNSQLADVTMAHEALEELQNAFYYEEMDFSEESNQQIIKTCYSKLQPYLEKINPEYYTNLLIKNIITPLDYEKLLSRIAKDDSNKLLSQISQVKINSIYGNLLSATHELRALAKENIQTIANITPINEKPSVNTLENKEQPTTTSTKVSDLKLLIDGFHELQERMNILNTSSDPTALKADQDTLNATIEDISLACSKMNLLPQSISNVLNAIKQLHAALNNTAVNSHDLIIGSIKNIRAQFHEAIIKPIDDAEFKLGLKPGALSAHVSEHFDKFYLRLLDHVVNDMDQNDLMLLVTKPIQDRIASEQGRLNALRMTEPKSSVEIKENEFNIKRVEAKIDYLKDQLVSEPHQKIEQFKRHKFDEYLNNTLPNLLKNQLGSYADAYFKEIQPHLLQSQDEILKAISIEDDLGKKIAETLLPRLSRLMAEIDQPQKENTEMKSLKDSYDKFIAAHVQHNEIRKLEEELQHIAKNPLINRIKDDIQTFELKIAQFSKDYKKGDDISMHLEECSHFKQKLDNYKLITNKENQAFYESLMKEINSLTKRTDLSPIEQKKLDFINFYEQHMTMYAAHHSEQEVLGEINYCKETFNEYSKLIEIDKLTKQLLSYVNPTNLVTEKSSTKSQIIECATKISHVINDSTSTNVKLEKISDLVKVNSTLPTVSKGNPLINFFESIMQKIKNVITSKSTQENPKETIKKFQAFKTKFQDIVVKETEAPTISPTSTPTPSSMRSG